MTDGRKKNGGARPGAGRKKKPVGEKKHQMTITMSPEMHRWLAERRDISQEIIDHAVRSTHCGIYPGDYSPNKIQIDIEWIENN